MRFQAHLWSVAYGFQNFDPLPRRFPQMFNSDNWCVATNILFPPAGSHRQNGAYPHVKRGAVTFPALKKTHGAKCCICSREIGEKMMPNLFHAVRHCFPPVFALLVFSASFSWALSDNGGLAARSPAYIAGETGTMPLVSNDQDVRNAGQAQLEARSSGWEKRTIDTTAGASYLTEIARKVIIEINMLRTDPAKYARRYLVPLRAYYHNNLLQLPGEIAISTDEGISALDECIRELQAVKPLFPLTPKKGLTLAASDQAKDQGRTGATGHTGSDGSTTEERLSRYGTWDTSAGENINYGGKDARNIVVELLIDDGVSLRGHRRNLLNVTFRYVGISVGPHPVYGHVCVMDFAGSYH
jgi:uncharacterized protein YkwD